MGGGRKRRREKGDLDETPLRWTIEETKPRTGEFGNMGMIEVDNKLDLTNWAPHLRNAVDVTWLAGW